MRVGWEEWLLDYLSRDNLETIGDQVKPHTDTIDLSSGFNPSATNIILTLLLQPQCPLPIQLATARWTVANAELAVARWRVRVMMELECGADTGHKARIPGVTRSVGTT